MRTFSGGFRGPYFLKVVDGEQIVVFTMAAQKAGDVRTQRDDLEMVGAGKIERGAGEFRGYAVALEGRGDFSVLEHEAVGRAAIGD